jgi:D-tyrosyl-tRNA(Tyr) deacylase
MKVLLQRVTEASVTVEGERIGAIDRGLLIFVCAVLEDSEVNVQKLAAKVAKLRIFQDDAGKMNRAIKDVGGAALVVSQFTLAANTRKGNRPSFIGAAPPEQGNALYEAFANALRAEEIPVEVGRFGADMKVQLINDGPVTLWLEG